MTEEIKEYLRSVTKEQLDADYAAIQMEKETVDNMQSIQKWITLLDELRSSDEWAYEMYSDALRAIWSPNDESKRPETLQQLQDECLFEIDYFAKHKDKDAKIFMQTVNFDKYAIMSDVKEKWYKVYKRC